MEILGKATERVKQTLFLPCFMLNILNIKIIKHTTFEWVFGYNVSPILTNYIKMLSMEVFYQNFKLILNQGFRCPKPIKTFKNSSISLVYKFSF